MNNLKKIGAALGLALAFSATSCIGPNNAFNSLNTWNSKLSDSKLVNEVVFIGGHIIPVYPLFMLGDVLIFNSIEFWTGSNPISKPEEFKPQETK